MRQEKNVEFTWTQKQNKAFEALKKVLTSKPVLNIFFDPKKEVTLTTDASEHVIAAVVSQKGSSNHVSMQKALVSRMHLFQHWKGSISHNMERVQNFFVG